MSKKVSRLAPGFQKFYQHRGGILVLACGPGFEGFAAVVFRHGLLFSQGRPRPQCLELLNFRSTRLGSQSLLTRSQKNIAQKQKSCGKQDDNLLSLVMNIMSATIEEPRLDTQRAGTLETPSGGAVNM